MTRMKYLFGDEVREKFEYVHTYLLKMQSADDKYEHDSDEITASVHWLGHVLRQEEINRTKPAQRDLAKVERRYVLNAGKRSKSGQQWLGLALALLSGAAIIIIGTILFVEPF